MLNDKGQLAPGRYRVTLDDGSTDDYDLTGHSQLDHGDFLTVQPGGVSEIANDAKLSVSRVVMVVSGDGRVWSLPSNRLREAELVPQEVLADWTAAYLAQAPFHAPVASEAPVRLKTRGTSTPDTPVRSRVVPGNGDHARATELLRVDDETTKAGAATGE